MKTFLQHAKRVGAYYLNSWWLPPLVVLICTVLSILIMIICRLFIKDPYRVNTSDIVAARVFLSVPLSLLGFCVSCVWLMVHKRWLKTLGSVFFVLIVFFLVILYAGLTFPAQN